MDGWRVQWDELEWKGRRGIQRALSYKAEKFALFVFGEFVETVYLEATACVVGKC
jgi:hypothetical protein